MHGLLNLAEHELIYFIREVFKALVMIYEKIIWVQCSELERLLAEANPRLISILISPKCLQDVYLHQKQSTSILPGE